MGLRFPRRTVMDPKKKKKDHWRLMRRHINRISIQVSEVRVHRATPHQHWHLGAIQRTRDKER